MTKNKYLIDKKLVSLRLDKALTLLEKNYSRVYFSNLIKNQQVLVNNKVVSPSYKVNENDEVEVNFITSTKDENAGAVFFTKIAEATNSQKPIYARDLKSNSPEMLSLKRCLEREDVFLEMTEKGGDSIASLNEE